MSGELIAFLITVISLFMIGIPTITSRVSLPARLDLKDVHDPELTEAQRNAFAQLDPVFERLNMQPRRTFTAANLPSRNINRVYTGSREPVIAMATFMTDVTDGDLMSVEHVVEFITEYADGTSLSTQNATVSGLFVPDPKQTQQSRPGVRDIEALKLIHDRKVPQVSGSPRISFDPDELFQKMQRDHAEMCERQRIRGLLDLDPVTGRYRSTTRLALKGIRNYLNPFADNFSWVKLILAVSVSVGLSGTAALAFGHAGFREWLSPVLPAEGMNSWFFRYVVLSLAYAVSGTVLGCLVEKKAFVWGFLTGIVPLLFIPGGVSWIYPMILSGTAGTVSEIRQIERKVA